MLILTSGSFFGGFPEIFLAFLGVGPLGPNPKNYQNLFSDWECFDQIGKKLGYFAMGQGPINDKRPLRYTEKFLVSS